MKWLNRLFITLFYLVHCFSVYFVEKDAGQTVLVTARNSLLFFCSYINGINFVIITKILSSILDAPSHLLEFLSIIELSP